MQWIAEISEGPKQMRCVIEETTLQDIKTGEKVKNYYVYVWENGSFLYDYLQDTLDQAKGFALRKFQVPLDAWTQVSDSASPSS